ncbi:hypothetical protein [Neobacillus sp.]|uniref:hypothetical protein n=1 Tax=Neobacillus sp. TaxID=2675273 RepID=UPI00289733E1|nr:hypothetical protein [Neobacillus sp.]
MATSISVTPVSFTIFSESQPISLPCEPDFVCGTQLTGVVDVEKLISFFSPTAQATHTLFLEKKLMFSTVILDLDPA